jgi:hypothetical protein
VTTDQATFDPALIDDHDWVRQLLGDTDMSKAVLTDAQIYGGIAEVTANTGSGTWVKYLAAAVLGETVLARWQAMGNGVVEKQVGPLRIRRLGSDTAESAYAKHLDRLRDRGNVLLLRNNGRNASVFRVL